VKPVLDPIDRVSEVIFGVLMAMTFIGAMNVAEAGQGEVRKTLIAALGCNVAWGLTDGIMHLVAILTERTRERASTRLTGHDFKGALTIFVLVTASTFPLVVPFMLFKEIGPALLGSRLVALALLFLGGWVLAKYSGGNRWLAGTGMAAIGALLIGALIALGG